MRVVNHSKQREEAHGAEHGEGREARRVLQRRRDREAEHQHHRHGADQLVPHGTQLRTRGEIT